MESPFRTIDHTFIYVLDREAIATSKIKVLWVDEHGQRVLDNVIEADSTECLSLALENYISFAEIINWQAVRGALIVGQESHYSCHLFFQLQYWYVWLIKLILLWVYTACSNGCLQNPSRDISDRLKLED